MAKIYRCKRSFALGSKGVARVVPAGKVLPADDPLLAGRQDLLDNASLFEPLETYLDRTVEQATAAPGEKRSVSRPPRRGAGRTKAESKGDEKKDES